MRILQKTLSSVILISLLISPSSSFAATNKDTVITSIDSLNASIATSIALKGKTLSDRASELGNRYDAAIKALGFQSDEVEALTSIKSLGVPSFRQEVALAYADLKDKMLGDIQATQASLTALHDEVALGYSDLSMAQKQSYDAKIGGMQASYSSFLTGSTASIDDFTNTFSWKIAPRTELIKKMMSDNGKYILFIRDIRSGYARIDEKRATLLSQKAILEKDILPKIQGGFVVFTANKKIFTDAIRADLISGLEKAMVQERLKKQETELRAYVEDIMSKWNEYLRKNFWQDDELVDVTKDMENAITLEKALHNRVYDTAGNIQSLEMSGSTILTDMTKLDSRLWSTNSVLAGIIATYSSGNTLGSLSDKLLSSYKTELFAYRSDFTTLLEKKLGTSLLEEKNHAQVLSLLDQEEKILKQNLETTNSIDFTEQLVNDFIAKIMLLAKDDGGSDSLKKAQMLSYRYKKAVVQKRIEDASLSPYYSKRIALDKTLSNLFITLENKSGRDALLVKFPLVSEKIRTLLGTKISLKNRYTLLVVQSNILKYLEDATK